MFKKILPALAILALTACTSVNVTEKESSKNILKNLDTGWSGEVVNSFDGKLKEYKINIEDVMIEFNEDSYDDVYVNIRGQFLIDSNDEYSVNSDIYIKLIGHSVLDKDGSKLKIKNIRTGDIQFKNLYDSYIKDIELSLKHSLDDVSDLYLSGPSLLEFDGYTKLFSKFYSSDDYYLIKDNDGERIKIEFKETE